MQMSAFIVGLLPASADLTFSTNYTWHCSAIIYSQLVEYILLHSGSDFLKDMINNLPSC